jgi:SAM-dependent methyltransferase
MSGRVDVYGKYSLGSGAILADKDKVWSGLADAEVIAAYEASIRRDLAKSGIPLDALSRWSVIDVGTGRQALALLNLGVRHVSHFDLSHENVGRMQAHIQAHGLGERLDTTCCDLVDFDLGRERFDFVYLNGIVQHFSDVGRGLARCMRALKPNGLLWLYFYRSGTFDNFVLYTLRTLANGGNVVTDDTVMRDYYAAARLFFSAEAGDNYLTSIFMDGVFTRYAWLYTARTYLDVAEACGFDVVSSSGLDPLGLDVDHYFARAATVVTLKKARAVSDMEIDRAVEALAPAAQVDQLNGAHYHASEIRQSLALVLRLRHLLDRPDVPNSARILVVMRLFSFLAEKTRAQGYDALRRHTDLHDILTKIVGLIAAEYGDEA